MFRCVRCRSLVSETATACTCGFPYDNVSLEDLPAWFEESRRVLESSFVIAETPWQQSGKGGSFDDWAHGRRVIADCIDRAGSFLDVGCANGYLLECLLKWSRHSIDPYGVDHAPRLVAMAQDRLPEYRSHFYLGNAWTWTPPRRFDFVRTELVYVPKNYQRDYAQRLLDEFVEEDGRLLAAEYGSKRHDHEGEWVDERLRAWGFHVIDCRSGFADNRREVARIAVVAR